MNDQAKTWDVEDYGTVGEDHAIWIHCENTDVRNAMKVEQTHRMTFKKSSPQYSGVGRDLVWVKRLT